MEDVEHGIITRQAAVVYLYKIILVSAALVLLYAAAQWGVAKLAFYPMKYPQGAWGVKPAGAEDVQVVAADGTKLHGWYLPVAGAKYAELFLHGNAGNVTHRAAHMRAIAMAGRSVLVVDYRGFGKSEGTPSEKGVYEDATAMYEFLLQQGYAPEQIVLHGESLGSAVTVELATRVKYRAMILETPFTRGADMANLVAPVIGGWLFRRYDTLSRIDKLHGPLLVIHGSRDEVIPVEFGKRVFVHAREPKQLWIVEGAGHNDLLERAMPEYVNRVSQITMK